MEPHQEVKQWLNSRQDYAAGVDLAKAHNVRGVTRTLLDSGENEYSRKKLREFLQKVVDELSAHVGAPAARPAVEQAPVAVAAPVPAELLELRRQRTQAFKQGNDAFTKMKVTPPGEARRLYAVQVKQLSRENARLWAAEEYYLKFGFLPQPQLPATLDRTDLRAVEKRRNTLRTYLSHASEGRRGRADATKPAAWQAELMELDLILAHG